MKVLVDVREGTTLNRDPTAPGDIMEIWNRQHLPLTFDDAQWLILATRIKFRCIECARP